MPQLDKATFLPIVFWTFAIYSFGYLFLNTTFMYGFFSALKLAAKRNLFVYGVTSLLHRFVSNSTVFPLVAL